MKAKEFLNKIMRGDRITLRKNTGLIRFDEKGNHIEEGGGDLSDFEFVPFQILQAMGIADFDDNPSVGSIIGQGSMVRLFAMSRNAVTQSDFVVECDYNSERHVFSTVSFYSTMITSEDVSEMESSEREYYEPRVGMYFIDAMCRSQQEMDAGDTARVYVDISGEVVLSEDCIVHKSGQVS